MIVAKIHLRLIKEFYLALRHLPETVDYPAYFFPVDRLSGDDELAACVDTINDLPSFPWPDIPCVMFVEQRSKLDVDPDERDEGDGPVDTRNDSLHAYLVGADGHVSLWDCVHWIETSEIEIGGMWDGLLTRIPTAGADFGESGTPHTNPFHMVSGYPPALQVRTASAWMIDGEFKTAGMAVAKQSAKRALHYNPQLIEDCANLVFPCGYIVRTTFQEGFGPGPFRRRTAGKSILSIVNYDRVYSTLASPGEGHVSPHDRRGHIRWHWKAAGIDRNKLPIDHRGRLRVAMENRVAKSYVSPTWVGRRTAESEGLKHEIELGAALPGFSTDPGGEA